MPTCFGNSSRLAVAVLLLAPFAAAVADDRAIIEEIVSPFLKDKPYLGVVVGVTRAGGKEIVGYGEVTLDGKRQKPTGDTIFEIGSITKVFTGTLLADQVLAGRLRLDDPVQPHLPEGLVLPRRDDRDITFLHLATHTSGLPKVPLSLGLFSLVGKDPKNPYSEFDQTRLKKTLPGVVLPRPIGGKFDYSNLGVGVLGHALAQRAKANSFEDLLIERLVKPLNLDDTRMQLSVEQSKRLAPGHEDDGKPTSNWTFACLEACGGLRSTARDLLAFEDAALSRRESALSDAFRLSRQAWRDTDRKGHSVGLCWMRQTLPKGDRVMIWHNGGTGGYRSFLAFNPETGTGIVVLSNSSNSVDALGIALLERLDKGE